MTTETIVAVSTPPGRGGIGVVRLAGPAAAAIARQICGIDLRPRHAHFAQFRDADGCSIDAGIVIHYPAPGSYTGDDVSELQAHGSPVVLDQLVQRALALGARAARPGEFTERAFLNDRLDLAQAEAVADLIAAQSVRAARAAQRSLAGEFGQAVAAIVAAVRAARAELEAGIDFAEDVDDSDLLRDQAQRRADLLDTLDDVIARASSGARLRSGATLAIAGAPNVGKSSLLNRLAARERAIVSDRPGTTRDLVEADILVAGLPLTVIDTAGLRVSADDVEREGMARAEQAIAAADLTLLVTDDPNQCDAQTLWQALGRHDAPPATHVVVLNKIDRLGVVAGCRDGVVSLSALSGAGLDALHSVIANRLGVDEAAENEYAAQQRHLDALRAAREALAGIDETLVGEHPEIAAEHYRRADAALETIAGRHTSEDLLGAIFARFCIGK